MVDANGPVEPVDWLKVRRVAVFRGDHDLMDRIHGWVARQLALGRRVTRRPIRMADFIMYEAWVVPGDVRRDVDTPLTPP